MAEGVPMQQPTWSWPEEPDDAGDIARMAEVPGAFTQDEVPEGATLKPEQGRQSNSSRARASETAPGSAKTYSPRTCRICLEVVQPTFETAPEEGLHSRLHPTPRVSYISEDPESGRLIRPCHCKGSQKYVHEGCLQTWRYSDTSQQNFWECPTCKFRYRLERLRFSRWISHTVTEIVLTSVILLIATFLLGFIADPIIDLYLDPFNTITSMSLGRHAQFSLEPEDASWTEHFLKGLASLGLMGFLKILFTLPWWHIRQGGALGGVGRGRGLGRNRLENISWGIAIAGVITFLYVSDSDLSLLEIYGFFSEMLGASISIDLC